MSLKEPNSKLIRWKLNLEEFDYEIVYKKGNLKTLADALSKINIANPKTAKGPKCQQQRWNPNFGKTF